MTTFKIEYPDELQLSDDQKSRFQFMTDAGSPLVEGDYLWFQWQRPYADELADIVSTWMVKQDFRHNEPKIMATITAEYGNVSKCDKFYIYPVKVTYSGAYFIIIGDVMIKK
ncbi:hypothetical protein D1872_37000 [compost metagenome]